MARHLRVYVRLARHDGAYSPSPPYKVDANVKPNPAPLTVGSGRHARELHTIRFAVDLQIPDGLFNPKDWPTVELELTEAAGDKVPIRVVSDGGAEVEVEVGR